jgi:transketolase
MIQNSELRKQIVRMITEAGEGHIPSSFSIVDLISVLYDKHLRVSASDPDLPDRDHFILSKGHGCAALYVVLEQHGFLQQSDLDSYGTYSGILGGHPDRSKVPGVEASTGSLGHGFPFAVGVALGQKLQGRDSRVFALVGDGECHEGTIWEGALVGQNLGLSNLCCIVDYNHSSSQILPHPDLVGQWRSFGWNVRSCEGHDFEEIDAAFAWFTSGGNEGPHVIIANTTKGKGVGFMETHGPWHHKIPNSEELAEIMAELSR